MALVVHFPSSSVAINSPLVPKIVHGKWDVLSSTRFSYSCIFP